VAQDPVKTYNEMIYREIAEVKKELRKEPGSEMNSVGVEIIFRGGGAETRCIIKPGIVVFESFNDGKRYLRTRSLSPKIYERLRVLLQRISYRLVFDSAVARSNYIRFLHDSVENRLVEMFSASNQLSPMNKKLARYLEGGDIVVRSVKIPRELDNRIRQVSRRLGVSMSELIRWAVTAYLDALEDALEKAGEEKASDPEEAESWGIRKVFVNVEIQGSHD